MTTTPFGHAASAAARHRRPFRAARLLPAAAASAVLVSAVVLFLRPRGAAAPGPKRPGDSFTVGFELGYEPYGFFDPGKGAYAGCDLELAAEVARRNRWKLVLAPIDWRVKERILDSGDIDCIWNGFKIDGRESQFTWSRPYLSDAVIVVSRPGVQIKTVDDLVGKTLAVQSTTPHYAFLQPGGKWESIGRNATRIIPVDDFVLLLAELRDNPACDAIITDYLATEYWKNVRHRNWGVYGLMLARTSNAVAFRLGNTALRDQVQTTLDQIVRDGTFARIQSKWFPRAANPHPHPTPSTPLPAPSGKP